MTQMESWAKNWDFDLTCFDFEWYKKARRTIRPFGVGVLTQKMYGDLFERQYNMYSKI